MKKILSVLLLVFAMLLSACGEVKYEIENGIMYGDGKEASGTFEFKANEHKVKGNFVNGLPDGLFEEYYEDGSIMAKNTFVNGELTVKELYYKNGKLMAIFTENDDLKLFYNDGSPIMSYDAEKNEATYYHENGNILMVNNNYEATLYDENNEVLSVLREGEPVDIGANLKKLEDGSFETVKNGKVLSKLDSNGDIRNYFYSTGELLLKSNDNTGELEFFFKNGNTFMRVEGNERILNYKDGKILYEMDGDLENIYSEDGNKIVGSLEVITDIKKID